MSKKKTASTMVKGADLVPDLSKVHQEAETYVFWVGLLPECPSDFVTLAGICFPKQNDDLVDDPLGGSRQQRIPKPGAIVTLTREKFNTLIEVLPRTIVRFTKGVPGDPQHAQTVGDIPTRRHRGTVITMKTEEELAELRKQKRPANAVVPKPDDRPIADYIFMRLCEDQTPKGNRTDTYPDVVSNTGLAWPTKSPVESMLET